MAARGTKRSEGEKRAFRDRSVTVPQDTALTLARAALRIREAMKDKSYQGTPVGVMVARYIRWLRNEYGATPSTIRDYEAVLARMSLSLADKDLSEVSIEDLRDVIDLWGDRAARTRQKVTSVIRAFWSWAEEQGHIALSPATRIRRPRAEQKVASLLPLDARPRLLSQAKHPRDRLALFCLLGLGLRRAELAGHSDPRLRRPTGRSSRSRQGPEGTPAPPAGSRPRGAAVLALDGAPASQAPPGGRRLPALPDPPGAGRQGPGGAVPPNAKGFPEAEAKPAVDPSLVVPPGAGGRTRRARSDERPKHAPRPAHLCDRATPGGRDRRRIPRARPRRPEHDARHLRASRRFRPGAGDGRLRPLARARRANRSPRRKSRFWLSNARKVETAGIEPASAIA